MQVPLLNTHMYKHLLTHLSQNTVLQKGCLQQNCTHTLTHMLRGQVSHTGNEKQKSQIWMEFGGMKDREEPQSIPLGAQLKSLCDWHKALVALSFTPLTFHLKAFPPT